MEREIVTEADLIQIINDELAATDFAAECRFEGVFALPDPDDAGCNWSTGHLNSGGIPAEICGPVVDRVINALQVKYNIKPGVSAT